MNFYFIDNQYFIDFPDTYLMGNKEGQDHDRPCYYAFQDVCSGIYWVIPISSQVLKYRTIHDRKVEKFGVCDTITFGRVLGNERVFLLQNMCPITDKYVKNIYINESTGNPVTVSPQLASDLSRKGRKILALLRKGRKLIFPNVLLIESSLLQQQEVAATKE